LYFNAPTTPQIYTLSLHDALPIYLLDQSIRETRTISHLLHPSGLDEIGFSAAATSYAEGFAQRSGLQLDIKISEPTKRLPRETRSEEHTSELQSRFDLVCRLLLEK